MRTVPAGVGQCHRPGPATAVSAGGGRGQGSRERTRLAIRYFDDRILLTDTHAWAYHRLPSVSYEFTTAEEREALATNITVALAAIKMQDAEVHLRIAHRAYPAHAWATGLDDLGRDRAGGSVWSRSLPRDAVRDHTIKASIGRQLSLDPRAP
jgi:hypothetical protein